MSQEYYLIVFNSTHAAMSAEAFLKKNNLNVKLVPLPSVISAGCGFSIKVLPSEVAGVEAWLKQSAFEWSGLYKLVKIGSKTSVYGWDL